MRRFLQRSAANGALTRCATKSPQAYSCGTSRKARKRNTVRLDDGGTAVEKLSIIRDKSLRGRNDRNEESSPGFFNFRVNNGAIEGNIEEIWAGSTVFAVD